MFYESITNEQTFDDVFFKKVYGYSVYDNLFLPSVAAKLIGIGRKDVVQAYNQWFASWKAENDQAMKRVAEWYTKECDMQYKKILNEQQKKAVKDWKTAKRWETIADLLNYQLE